MRNECSHEDEYSIVDRYYPRRRRPNQEKAMNDADNERLTRLIASDDSPVGIDAKKTHVLILHKLEQIEARLARLETAAASKSGEQPQR